MNTIEGDNTYPMFPSSLQGNRLQYDTDGLPQLQLFGNFPVGCSVGSLNYAGSEHNPVMEKIKGGMDVGSLSSQLKHPILLNNNSFPDKVDHSGYAPNTVSIGLRLSYDEDEHNSSLTCANEGIKAVLPIISSLGDNLKVEIDQQKQELDCYIKSQEENIIKGLRELRQRHTVSFLSAIEEGINRRLYEKDLEIESMSRKNKELLEKIKQVSMEVQSWQYRAKYNESVVNVLRNNLQQVMALGKEACGDSEIEDVASCSNNVNYIGVAEHDGDLDPMKNQVNCRVCKVKETSVLVLPCRHLCLCKDCEVFIHLCPICGMMKTASVEVFMS